MLHSLELVTCHIHLFTSATFYSFTLKIGWNVTNTGSGARAVCLRTEDYEVHDVTTALKRFLRNLDDPLLTRHLSLRWTQATGTLVSRTEL